MKMKTNQQLRRMGQVFADRGGRMAHTDQGFSALETLIALAIAAVAMLAVASLFPSAYTNVSRSGRQTAAVNLAQQRIEWVRNQPYAGLPATTETNVAFDTTNYPNWTRTTAITVNPDLDGAGPDPPVVGVTQVTVTVTPPTGVGAPVTVRSLVAE